MVEGKSQAEETRERPPGLCYCCETISQGLFSGEDKFRSTSFAIWTSSICTAYSWHRSIIIKVEKRRRYLAEGNDRGTEVEPLEGIHDIIRHLYQSAIIMLNRIEWCG